MFTNYRQIVLIGGRGVALATLVISLLLAVQPIDLSNIDAKFVAASFFALVTWVGLEFNQYYLNFKPTEHPSDINLARTILNKIHLNELYFFENYDFGGSFRYEKLDGINYLYGFTLVQRKNFHNSTLDKKLNEVTGICVELLAKIGERGGLLHGGSSYIIMSDDEFVARNSGLDVSEETERRILSVNNLAYEFTIKFKELHQLLLDLLPTAFEEEK